MLVPNLEKTEKFTWADLKAFCDTLNSEQLTQEVIVPQDESNITIKYASELGEDQWYFIDQEYTTTKADFDPDMFDECDYKTLDEALENEDASFIPGSNIYLFDEYN